MGYFSLKLFLSFFSIAGFIWILFNGGEIVLKPKYRLIISDWLKNKNENIDFWPKAVSSILITIFSDKYFSYKSFFRSTLASLSFVIILTLIFLILVENPFDHLRKSIELYFFWILMNIVVDFFSLIQSRDIIELMNRFDKSAKLLLLLVDLVFNIFIFSVGAVLLSISNDEIIITSKKDRIIAMRINEILPYVNEEYKIEGQEKMESYLQAGKYWQYPIRNASEVLLESIVFWRTTVQNPVSGIFFYSTFLTSFWVWIYLLGGFLIKRVYVVKGKIIKLEKIIEIENQPLRSIGLVFILFLFLVVFIIAPILSNFFDLIF